MNKIFIYKIHENHEDIYRCRICNGNGKNYIPKINDLIRFYSEGFTVPFSHYLSWLKRGITEHTVDSESKSRWTKTKKTKIVKTHSCGIPFHVQKCQNLLGCCHVPPT